MTDDRQRQNLLNALCDAVETLQRDCEELDRILHAIEETAPPTRADAWESFAQRTAAATFAPKPGNLLRFVRRGSYLDHAAEFESPPNGY